MSEGIRVFGTVEITHAGRSVPVARGQQERLLGALVLAAGRPVTVDTLTEAVRSGRPDRTGDQPLYPVVSRLRRALAPIGATIRPGTGTYTLHCPPDRIDLCRFDRLLADGRAALRTDAPAVAVPMLSDAVALVRGPLLGDLTGTPFDDERRRLDLQCLTARTELAEARLTLGHHRELLADLELLVARNPLHEPATALLVLALYRCGRQSHAMDVFHDLRRRLADELGQRPSPELAALYERILAQDGRLAWTSAPRPEIWNLPTADGEFVGREQLLGRLRAHPAGVIALHGLPGVGKTRLALEYAQASDSEVVWWCPAASADASLSALAARLGAADDDDLDATRLAFRRTLARRPGWLLVVDDVEDFGPIARWLPPRTSGQVLITSRRADWRRHATPVVVPVLRRAESVALLRRRTGRTGPSLERLAERLGDLPLALERAAAFCDRTGESVAGYLGLLDQGEDDEPAAPLRRALDRVVADEPRAEAVLRYLAARGRVPTTGLPGRPGRPGLSRAALLEVIGALRRHSLVERHGDRVSVHPLVRAAVASRSCSRTGR
ncbi:BTAD domain-containing putative transcriptional regulator [Cryptosporangium sp. NPDC051539]|uniref:BTAD domain-containing putative transcriptional regulator n=1 Tax=Cryptosporangium sp. NPDC051539 TaxID=3363962 RepID=UPI0037A002CF